MNVLWYRRDGTPLLAESFSEWNEYMHAFETGNRVAVTILARPRITVSTVFLGFNHNFSAVGPPSLFETTTFARIKTPWKWAHRDGFTIFRYATEAEALAGHQAVVAQLRGGARGRPVGPQCPADHLNSVSTSSVMIPGTNARTLA